MVFKIVVGSHGDPYRGVIKDEDYTDCTAKIYVWDPDDDTIIIDGVACVVTLSGTDTHITYTVVDGDFNVTLDRDPKAYKCQFMLQKTGVRRYTIPIDWLVYGKYP